MEKQVKPLILILCTGNSCRSHMAEGVLREVAGDVLNVQSAGSAPTGSVHPLAILTLGEIGIDISSHTSKHMNEFLSGNVETVITVCDNADQACPSFPGLSYRHHWPFPDPAKAEGTEAEIRNIFEQVRDDIRRVFADYGLSRIKSIQGLPS
jgi:arsenate reductase